MLLFGHTGITWGVPVIIGGNSNGSIRVTGTDCACHGSQVAGVYGNHTRHADGLKNGGGGGIAFGDENSLTRLTNDMEVAAFSPAL